MLRSLKGVAVLFLEFTNEAGTTRARSQEVQEVGSTATKIRMSPAGIGARDCAGQVESRS